MYRLQGYIASANIAADQFDRLLALARTYGLAVRVEGEGGYGIREGRGLIDRLFLRWQGNILDSDRSCDGRRSHLEMRIMNLCES